MARKKAFPSSTTGTGCLDDANEGRGQPGARQKAALDHIVEGPPPVLIDGISR